MRLLVVAGLGWLLLVSITCRDNKPSAVATTTSAAESSNAPPADPPAPQPPHTQPADPTATTAPARRTLSERQKIERLIKHVGSLDDAVFIRNDADHSCDEAAGHMRDKWKWKKQEISTARDFIRIAATKSTVSGKPYLIRFKDGREVMCGAYLLGELDRIEAGLD